MARVVTIPNLLTFVRMALIPAFASLLFYQEFGWALTLFFFAGLSDAIDGYIARHFNQQSELGSILDPIADKLLVTTAFVLLTLNFVVPKSANLPVPFWLTASVIARDILIIVVAAAIFAVSGFRKFRPSIWGKISTVVQVFGIGLILIATTFPEQFNFYLPFVYWIIFVFAAISGFHYIYQVAGLMNEENSQSN